MKKLLTLALMGWASAISVAQKAPQALQQMIAAEKAFAQLSLDNGTNTAFLAYFAPTGVTFQNNQPTNGQAHWQKQPEDKGKLTWTPIFGNIASSGDLGYDTGPWAYYTTKADTKPSATGSFITVWQKQSTGVWKVALDLGVGHSEIAATPFVAASSLGGKPANQDTAMVKAALISTDYLFSKTLLSDGALRAYSPYLTDNTRLYRYGVEPILQKGDILKLLEKPSQKTKFEPMGGGVSQAGDLGYVYGTATTDDKVGNYLRVWRRSAKHTWELALEVVALPVE
ncbi:MAG: hypothetical protein U0Y10_00795 [Spirosomataceae bacterium]